MLKLSTRKIIGIAGGVTALTLASLLMSNSVLREYLQVAVLAAGVAASVFLMGWAKPRGYNTKLVATLIVLAAIVFQVVMFLLLGLKLGFVQNIYGWNFSSLIQVFLPITLLIIGEEILRGQLIERGKGSLFAVITAGVTIWVVTVLIALPAYNLAEPKAMFIALTTVAGPAILTNILLTYIAYIYDYRINIGYRLVMELPVYLLPILPDAGVFLPALFQIGLILLLSLGLAGLHRTNTHKAVATVVVRKKPKRAESDQKRKVKRAIKWAGISLAAIIAVSYVVLMSGIFKYYFLAIGSGSMEPNLYRGDLILVEKSKDYGEMQVGDVLIYRHSNVVMVHRITEVSKEGNNYIYQTKGDNNTNEDVWQVRQGDVIGVAKGKIVAFGYPTLWLNELFNGES